MTQFAAATAVKGTNRPINGGADLTNELRPIAVTRAPPVAETYAVPAKNNVSVKNIVVSQNLFLWTSNWSLKKY